MILHVPTMCHTASIWLTVGLACQVGWLRGVTVARYS